MSVFVSASLRESVVSLQDMRSVDGLYELRAAEALDKEPLPRYGTPVRFRNPDGKGDVFMACKYGNVECLCWKTACKRHGKCCECVRFHREVKKNLPVCFRKETAEALEANPVKQGT